MSTFARMLPSAQWDSAMEEINFGGGTYKLWEENPANRTKICNAWNNATMEAGWGSFYNTSVNDKGWIVIQMSTQATEVCEKLGLGLSMRQRNGIRSDWKQDCLHQLRDAAKALSL